MIRYCALFADLWHTVQWPHWAIICTHSDRLTLLTGAFEFWPEHRIFCWTHKFIKPYHEDSRAIPLVSSIMWYPASRTTCFAVSVHVHIHITILVLEAKRAIATGSQTYRVPRIWIWTFLLLNFRNTEKKSFEKGNCGRTQRYQKWELICSITVLNLNDECIQNDLNENSFMHCQWQFVIVIAVTQQLMRGLYWRIGALANEWSWWIRCQKMWKLTQNISV